MKALMRPDRVDRKLSFQLADKNLTFLDDPLSTRAGEDRCAPENQIDGENGRCQDTYRSNYSAQLRFYRFQSSTEASASSRRPMQRLRWRNECQMC